MNQWSHQPKKMTKHQGTEFVNTTSLNNKFKTLGNRNIKMRIILVKSKLHDLTSETGSSIPGVQSQ